MDEKIEYNAHPKVSIGLPVYNGEKYLHQAIDSILCQTFTDFELIICDNASTDKTQEICEAYKAQDNRIRYFRNERNIGAAPNYNRAFQLSSSEYFRWAAYDDELAPDLLSKCIETLERNPDAILCYPRAQLIDGQGAFITNYEPVPNVCALDRPHERFREFLLHPHLALQIYGVYRSSCLRQTKLHRSFPSSDEVFLCELAVLGKFIELPEYLFLNRVHGAQSTQGPVRSRVAWIDTSLAGKIVLAHWLYFFGSLSVIRHASMNRSEKLYCYLYMLRWLAVPDHFRAMGKDLLLALRKFLAINIRKISHNPSGQKTQ